jgi:hypothetical protein
VIAEQNRSVVAGLRPPISPVPGLTRPAARPPAKIFAAQLHQLGLGRLWGTDDELRTGHRGGRDTRSTIAPAPRNRSPGNDRRAVISRRPAPMLRYLTTNGSPPPNAPPEKGRHMKLSNNNIAEILAKAMGRQVSGEGTWDQGRAAIQAFLRRVGVDPNLWTRTVPAWTTSNARG